MTPLSDAPYLGPKVPITLNRQSHPYSKNLAPSYIPDTLIRWPHAFCNPLDHPVENYVARKKVTETLLEALKEDINNHVELRIQNFALQLLLTYKTGLFFSLLNTETQIGEVKAPLVNEDSYAAAHSSTLPALHIASAMEAQSAISFAKDSSFYMGWNATVYLPEEVNRIDSAIDTKTRGMQPLISFRQRSLTLLNETSAGRAEPKTALISFLNALAETIETNLATFRRSTSGTTEHQRKIWDLYQKVALSYRQSLNSNTPLLQKLFFQPISKSVDEEFYFDAQREMHGYFQLEMSRLMPLKREITLKINQEQLAKLSFQIQHILTHYVQQLCKNDPKASAIGKTTQSYISLCHENEAVIQAASDYFNSLSDLSENDLWHSLICFDKVFKEKALDESTLSWQARAFCQAIRQVLIKEPQKLYFIIYKTLSLAAERLSLPKPKVSCLSQETKAALQKNIWTVIERGNKKQTAKMVQLARLAYLHNSVREASEELISELAPLTQELQQESAKALLDSSAKKPSSALSSKGCRFHAKTLMAIREHEKNEAYTPQQFGYIALLVLSFFHQ